MKPDDNKFILKFYAVFERIIVTILLVLMMIVVAVSVLEMVETMYSWLVSGKIFGEIGVVNKLHEIFATFLLVLIGIELLETIKMYIKENTIHVEVVFLVAMIAVARHVIDLKYEELNPLTLIGIAAIILALTAGYYLLKKSYAIKPQPEIDNSGTTDKK